MLYQVVLENLATLLEQACERSASGAGYPAFVANEFHKYLACGQLSRGFARIRCPDCGFERLVAFSCKGRLCPSCQARRAADTAAHLVDRLLPEAAYRQYVLTFPREVHFLLSVDPPFMTRMLGAYLQVVFAWQRRRGECLGIEGGQTGAVTFVQRFSSSLSLFPHLHSIVPDGLFVPGADGEAVRFVPLMPPTDDDVAQLTSEVVERLT
ncbi:MAG: transposase, partial [bacterium]|nr:transposase [bacterium]